MSAIKKELPESDDDAPLVKKQAVSDSDDDAPLKPASKKAKPSKKVVSKFLNHLLYKYFPINFVF
jgi:hypothetical protein